jgi:hypothetical protein
MPELGVYFDIAFYTIVTMQELWGMTFFKLRFYKLLHIFQINFIGFANENNTPKTGNKYLAEVHSCRKNRVLQISFSLTSKEVRRRTVKKVKLSRYTQWKHMGGEEV